MSQTTTITEESILKMLEEVAREYYDKGPGFAQETVVITEVARRLGIGRSLDVQQLLLDCWHNLFRKGVLSWGYNLDNPSSPWYHLAKTEP